MVREFSFTPHFCGGTSEVCTWLWIFKLYLVYDNSDKKFNIEWIK